MRRVTRLALREDRGSMNLVKESYECKYISMAQYATSQSSFYVVERHSELATGMDLGLGASQCFYSPRRRDWSARKRKTIHSQSRPVPFYYDDPPRQYLSWSSQFQSRRVLWSDIGIVKS